MSDDCGWPHWKFDLLVTGRGEQMGLEKLFRCVSRTGLCSFKVRRKFGQRKPRTSAKKHPKIVGTAMPVPDKFIEEIGFPAKRYLFEGKDHFVILIDDFEKDRERIIDDVRKLYEEAMCKCLSPALQQRCSVHFLVMMLEAYFLANTDVLNGALGLENGEKYSDWADDVEEIPHPKNLILEKHPHYRETEHAVKALEKIDVEHILRNPEHCKNLRNLFSWCMKKLKLHPCYDATVIPEFLANLV